MNRREQRKARGRAREQARRARRPAAIPIVSVSVPACLKVPFTAAVEYVRRLGPEDLDGCEVFALYRGAGATEVLVVPREHAIEQLLGLGEIELAEDIAEPAPGGRTRIVVIAPEDVRIYGFHWGHLAPGGDA